MGAVVDASTLYNWPWIGFGRGEDSDQVAAPAEGVVNIQSPDADRLPVINVFPLALYGVVAVVVGILVLIVLAVFVVLSAFLGGMGSMVIGCSVVGGMLVVVGMFCTGLDISHHVGIRRGNRELQIDPVPLDEITVVLTAYNDEASIGASVRDFLAREEVKRVIVVDNNSRDSTSEVARIAGAIVHFESKQGYGQCVYRALTEASSYSDTDVIVLCEGDMTFRAADLPKLAAYASHGDVINGTRIVEQLRCPHTQLTNFMYWGNFAAAKLLELKYLGRGTISDLGTTYKLCRSAYIRELLPTLDPRINLEFNAYFIDEILHRNGRIVEAPITFHPRVGLSKGGNTSNIKAARVGIRMIIGIVLSWRLVMAGSHDQ
jgi:hypothetical protein